MKIVVLGGYGEMGRVIVTDLSETYKSGEIVVAGKDGKKAASFAKSFGKKNIYGVEADIEKKSGMKKLLSGAKILINATNYYSNLKVMHIALENKVDYIDLGGLYHTTLEQLKLSSQFKKRGLTAILGCGSTPGITNIMAHYGAKRLDRIYSIDIQFADKDYTQYNSPFVVPYSMKTVFDEFSKKPALFENGKIRFVEPLSGEKKFVFPAPVGKTSCRYSLHSELASLPRAFKERGIKGCSFRGGWDPDFIMKTKFLIDAGLASENEMEIDGKTIVPRDLTVQVLNKFIPSGVKINDLEFLRVEINGLKEGKKKTVVVYCKATTNRKWNIPAGSWDTGVPASIIAQMIVSGHIKEKGVFFPEERCLRPQTFIKELKRRNMQVFIRSR